MATSPTIKIDTSADGSSSPSSILDQFRKECKSTKRLIMIRLVYVRWVADVSALTETFSAAFGIDMLWKATDSDVAAFRDNPTSYVPSWVPNFEFPNAKEITLERRDLVTGIPFKITPEGNNFLRTLCTGTFMEKFDLTSFPFDVQNLTVVMDLSFDLKEEALFVPWNESFSVNDPSIEPSATKNFVQLNRAFSAIPDFDAKRVLIEFAERDNCWGQVRIRIQMARRPEGMLGRVASLCCLLGVSTLSTFSMDPITDHASRISFCITNILAFTAFCFIVSSQLPMTPYLTLLDKYTLSSFCLLVSIMCCIAILKRVEFADDATRRNADDILFMASVVGIILVQIGFVVRGYQLRAKEHLKLTLPMGAIDKLADHTGTKPLNVYGTGLLNECRVEREGDPSISFQGSDNKGGNFF